jgi:hypothetical protein
VVGVGGGCGVGGALYCSAAQCIVKVWFGLVWPRIVWICACVSCRCGDHGYIANKHGNMTKHTIGTSSHT